MPEIEKSDEQYRKDVAEACEDRGIAAACWVENASQKDFAELDHLLKSGDYPKLEVLELDSLGK